MEFVNIPIDTLLALAGLYGIWVAFTGRTDNPWSKINSTESQLTVPDEIASTKPPSTASNKIAPKKSQPTNPLNLRQRILFGISAIVLLLVDLGFVSHSLWSPNNPPTPSPTVTLAPTPVIATATPTPTAPPSPLQPRIEEGKYVTKDTLSFGTAQASCDANETMVGGGYTGMSPDVPLVIHSNYPAGQNEWLVHYSLWQPDSHTLATPTSGRILLKAYAVCIPDSSIKTDRVQGTYTAIPATGTIALYAQCKAGETLISGGYDLPYDLNKDAKNVPYLQYDGFATASYPLSGNGWHVDAKWRSVPSANSDEGGSAYVLCGTGATRAVQSQIMSDHYNLSYESVLYGESCSKSQIATGGGYNEDNSNNIPSFVSDGPSPDSSTSQQWPIKFGGTIGGVKLYSVCVRFVTS